MKITNNMTKKEVLFEELKVGDVFTISGESMYIKTKQIVEDHTMIIKNTMCLNNGLMYSTMSVDHVTKVDAELIIS